MERVEELEFMLNGIQANRLELLRLDDELSKKELLIESELNHLLEKIKAKKEEGKNKEEPKEKGNRIPVKGEK